MPNEPFSAGELGRRLDRIEGLLLRLVSQDVYSRDQRETERRFTELERDLAEERDARKEAVKALREERANSGATWRQALYSGLIPAVFFVITMAVTLSRAGGK